MTWLFVPGTSSPSAQVLEDLNSASCSPSIIGERLAEASATWRGKEQPPQAWSRRWKQGGFIRRLSGLTCSPSMLDLGVAQFISSLREIPARTTALPVGEQAQRGSDFSPPKSAASPKSAGLILSSARTSRGTPTDSLRPSRQHWRGWATALRLEFSVRPQLATPCGASECSSLPNEWMAPVADDTGTRAKRYGQGGMALSMQATDWAAPQARDHFPAHTMDYIAAKKAEGHGMRNLNDEAAQWRGPSACSPNSLRGSGQDAAVRQAQGHQVNLQDQACTFRPPSSPDRPIAGGSMSSTDSPSSNQPSVKRKLNPIFVEALMRWPTGLSGFERQEMAWTRWWLLMPSFLSQLCSQPEGEAQMDLFGEAA